MVADSQSRGASGFLSGGQKPNDLRPPWLLGDFEQGEGDWELKAAWPRAARVQVEHSGVVALFGLVRVAADHSVEAGGLRF
jgi:hypothetical protein